MITTSPQRCIGKCQLARPALFSSEDNRILSRAIRHDLTIHARDDQRSERVVDEVLTTVDLGAGLNRQRRSVHHEDRLAQDVGIVARPYVVLVAMSAFDQRCLCLEDVFDIVSTYVFHLIEMGPALDPKVSTKRSTERRLLVESVHRWIGLSLCERGSIRRFGRGSNSLAPASRPMPRKHADPRPSCCLRLHRSLPAQRLIRCATVARQTRRTCCCRSPRPVSLPSPSTSSVRASVVSDRQSAQSHPCSQ